MTVSPAREYLFTMEKTTLWKNARIVTMDAARPRAEALVVRGGLVAFAGSDGEAGRQAGPDAEVRDLGGRAIVPGFNDNHVHAVIFGEHTYAPSLAGLDSGAIVETVRRHAEGLPAGRPVIAYGWDYPACPEPRKDILDAAFPRNPVVLVQFSGHGLWLNSPALEKLGIRRGSPDPAEGEILRDPDGEPTGILREMPSNRLVRGHLMRIFYDPSYRIPRLRRALDAFRRVGITSVQDNTWHFPVVYSLARLRRKGLLTARFSCWAYGRMPWTVPLMNLCPYDRDWVRRGPVKNFLDGTFSTRTACLSEAFEDAPDADGMCADSEEIESILRGLARKRRQGAFHIIGDRGISLFLDAAEAVAREFPVLRELRMRIEHAQLVAPRDIPRLRELGILVAAQPSSLATPEKDTLVLGEGRASRAYPYRALLNGGVHLSFGSDIPGEASYEPIRHIHMAANRPWPGRITAEEALRCYTVGSAYAEFQESRKGTLAPGMLADFAVLSGDITAIPPEEIGEVRVEMTVVGGRVVYDRETEGTV